MSLEEGRFWRECDRYHDLAEKFEAKIEYPDSVSSKRMCPFSYYCSWAASSVKYYTVQG